MPDYGLIEGCLIAQMDALLRLTNKSTSRVGKKAIWRADPGTLLAAITAMHRLEPAITAVWSVDAVQRARFKWTGCTY